MKKTMLLIDGHGLAFRGFYALPDTLYAPDGTPTNAILGFTNMLTKCLDEWQPEGVGLFFDPKGPTRRNELFEKYKEGRKPTPEAFKTQLPLIIEISKLMGVPVFIRDGVEADDYIYSTAKEAAGQGWRVKILSADKDLFQVVSDDIQVVRPTKGISEFTAYDGEFFEKSYGFAPVLMADYLALVGDAVDNIPGVAGIGDKTAKELITRFGCLEKIYEGLEELPQGKRTKLEEGRERAFMSRDLIVPQFIESAPVEELRIKEPDYKILKPLLERLALKKLSGRFGFAYRAAAKKREGEEPSSALSEAPEAISLTPGREIEYRGFEELLGHSELALTDEGGGKFFLCSTKGGLCEFDINNAEALKKWEHWCAEGTLTLYGLRELLVKYDLPLPQAGSIHDVEVAHYLLHPDRGGDSITKTIGRALPEGERRCAELFGLYDAFMGPIRDLGLEKLMNELDMPLCYTLAKLQRRGITVNAEALAKLENELEGEISRTEQTISAMAGETINLNSSKQVSWLLFEKLGLPPIKKTKTGYSTDVSVLEELSKLPEPLCDMPAKILEYREQAKILSGFVQPFLKLARSGDGGIHSTFDHLSTGTGRLSSRDPNVQNMPVFGTYASKFRKCFVPVSSDRVFVAADYSQIELRVLAHLSGEKKLVEAFETRRDIHTETASWVFDVPPEEVMPEQRRFAKVVNFGLLYGMGAFGLSQRLGIARIQAAAMVEKYFSVFPGIRAYLNSSVAEAKKSGFTRSIFGRIRPLKEVATTEGRGNSPLDRVALNTPIQSAASDIAKLALVRFSEVCEKEFKNAGVILQIHDSIICECDEKDADMVEKRLVEVMESVDVLSVPIRVETKRGKSLSAV